MQTPTYKIICTKNKEIAQGVHELRFNKPSEFKFEAGQFVLFQIPDINNSNDIQPRAYSIASSTNEDDLLFCVRIVPEGRAGKWFSLKLKAGTEMEMQGPMGNFKLNEKNKKGFIFVATGVGISPFRSQLIHLINTIDKCSIDLIWCTYNQETCFWVEEFEKLANENINFNFHISLSEPPKDWKGLSGRVQQIIPTIPEFNKKQIYICGNPAMTSDVKKLCLEEWKFPKADVHIEGYI